MKFVFGILAALVIPIVGTILTDAPAVWPLSTFLYNSGLILAFACVPNNVLRVIVYNLFAAALFIIEASFFLSYYIQNAAFNEAFFYHLRPDLFYAGIKEHTSFILIFLMCMLLFLVSSSFVLTRIKINSSWASVVALTLILLGLLISPPARALTDYIENFSTDTPQGALFEDYPELSKSRVDAVFKGGRRPNIVLIYAESLEQRFFDESIFPGMLANLREIKNQSFDFLNVSQGVGASWTVGGIVASQCGYPLAGSQGVEENNLSVFTEFLPKAVCLGDILGKDGYHLVFIGGADTRFAGKGDFLASHGYQEIISRDDLLATLADRSYQNEWGAYDDAMFDYGISKFRELSSGSTPFLLTLLTLDPHGPKGFLSRSCETYGDGENSSLNSFHCSDQLISRFIEQIRNSRYSENTLIIVLSDHLSMRNQAKQMLEVSRMPRRLTFFINTPEGKGRENLNPGVHYDIASTILDFIGYEIKGQVGFGAPLTKGPGYLPGRFGKEKWRDQSTELMEISRTLWDNSITIDENGIVFKASDLSLAVGGRELNLRSWGYTYDLSPTLMFFDDESLELKMIKTFPFGRDLTRKTLSQELLSHKEMLVLAIGRVGHLAGFSELQRKPDEWVYFFGKPGGQIYSWGPLTETLVIPFEVVGELRKSSLSERIIQERENLINLPPKHKAAQPLQN